MRWDLFNRRRNTPHPVDAIPRWTPRYVTLYLERLDDRIAPAVVTPFNPRFTANATGDIAITGNTMETASRVGNPGRTQQDVTNAQNGVGSFINNNDWSMAFVDVDTDPTTFNSSRATLTLPVGATVLFAGLYWGSVTTTPAQAQNTIRFGTPSSSGYASLTGTVIGSATFTGTPAGTLYQSFANVTSLVQAAGSGIYAVANVQATLATGSYAGWSLVVAYSAPGAPARNLTVFDGFALQASSDPALNIPITGFVAPPAGPVNAKVGVVAYEGDLGTTGDSMALNGKQLSDAATPVNNFFNSGISNQGVPQTAKNPNYVNQLGFDAKVINVPSGVVKNGDTSATVTLTTSGDGYFPGVVTTAIDLFAPNLDATKTVTDLNGGETLPGDTLEYTVNVTNTGQDPAGNVILTDPIPANTVYVPGSLHILSGANVGGKTDAASDDQAAFDGVNNRVVFNLGAGAAATTGGTLAIGASTSISFRVQVNPAVAGNTVIVNQATINYKGVTTGFPFTSLSTKPATIIAHSLADVAVTKGVSNPTPNVGDNVTFTVTATNNGPGPAAGVTLTDLLPSGLLFVNADASQGVYDNSSGLWTIGSLANGGTATLTIIARVISPNPQTNTATISGSDSIDPNAANNTASVTERPQQADLLIIKSVSDPKPHKGDIITYTLRVANTGPDTATGVTVNDLLPEGVTFVSDNPSQGTYDNVTGIWTVGSVASAATATLTIAVTVDKTNTIVNTATVDGDQFDPNLANNTDSSPVKPKEADLLLLKTVSDPTPNVGDQITFTVTLFNSGPDTADGVQVTDLLPSGLTFVSDNPSQGTYNRVTGLWDVGTVDTELTLTLTIVATVESTATETNTATITAGDKDDPNLDNNTGSATITIPEADLQVSKTVDNPTPNVGDTVTYTITVTNNGPDDATGVLVRDVLPPQMSLSSVRGVGDYDPVTGIWNVGTIPAGTSVTLTLTSLVTSPNPQANTATIVHSDQFDPNTANNSDTASIDPRQADLSLSKTVSDPTPNVGDTITFTVTLTNHGFSNATGVQVTDLLPVGLTLVNFNPSQGTYNSGAGLWTVGNLANGAQVTLTLQARVDDPGAKRNTATISHSDQPDSDLGNNTASATETPQQADLQITKTVDNPTPNVNDTITFTVTLADAPGSDPATNVRVNDLLPSGLRLVDAVPSQGTYAGGVWTVGTVDPSQAQTLTITAQVVSANPQTNTATISHSDQFDSDQGNNTASATETPQQADLQVTKTVNDPAPNVGDTILFTVTLTNNGTDIATNVSVTDLLPSGLTFVSDNPSLGIYDSTTGLWTVGTVGPGTSQTLQILATVTLPSAQRNRAIISHSDQFDPDTSNNAASATETPQQSDLQVSKTVDNPTPNVGDTVTYTITLTNNGPDDATNVTVKDILPPQVRLSLSRGVGDYDPATGIWTVGTLAAGESVTLTLTAVVVSPNPQANTATVNHSDQFDPNTANNSDTASINPQEADLQLGKTVSDPTPNVGDTVTFTVTLTNTGPASATNVRVNDLLPAGLAFVSATPSLGTYAPATGIWVVGTVTTATPQTLMIEARVISSSAETNTASIRHSDQFDPDTGNNTASATETPQRADLQLDKIVSDPTPNVGDTVTFLVTLNNNGPDAATNVRVTDLLPAGLSLVSPATPSQGSYDGGTGVWDVGSLANGAQATLALQARVDSPSAQTNTATISHSDQFDPNTGNNSGSATETPQQADLSLTKTVDDPTPNVGDTVTSPVTLTNNGPSPATNVQVTDLLPAGLTFVSATPSAGSYDAATGVWSVGTVALGPHTLTLQALVVSPSAQTNTTTITNSDQFDPNPGNDTASATETPQQADLVVGKSVSDPTPNVGDTITYTIRVTNAGPDDATGVTVQDILPTQVSFQSFSATQGSYDPITNTWTVGTVANATTETLTITVLVISSNPQANTASISHSDQFDPDTANNSDTASVNPQEANLELTKTVDDPTPNVGDTINFTVTLTNNGPSGATDVQVSDLLPAGLTLVNFNPSQGTYNSGTGLWDVGNLANGAQATLTFEARVVSSSAQTNIATISHSDQLDPNTGNNTGSATETPQQADLQITKTVSNATPPVGAVVTFTVTLTNNGPSTATGVQVSDLLPPGLTFLNAVPSQGTYNAAMGVWTVGDVPVGTPLTLLLTATVTSLAVQTNTAAISQSDQFDPNTGNNTASVTVTPRPDVADLAVTKVANTPQVILGQLVTFTITVRNLGPDSATNVIVTDQLPAGLVFVSAQSSRGTYNPETGRWHIPALSANGIATLRITAEVTAVGTIRNTARVAFPGDDPDLSNNAARDAIIGIAPAGGISKRMLLGSTFF